MKILHTSDWHIGRQLHNVSLLEDQAQVLNQIVEIVIAQNVDVVLVAGDLYDRAIPPAAAITLVDQVFDRLCRELNLPVIVIAGNHDSPERLGFAARQLSCANLHISGAFSATAEPLILQDEYGDIAFFSFPYSDPATIRAVLDTDCQSHDQATAEVIAHLSNKYPVEQRSVVLSHCFVAGGLSSESERPLSVGGAEQVSAAHFIDFNYAALGHLHAPQYRSKETIRYSGSILKYSFSEIEHQKSVTLVEMDEHGECLIEQFKLQPLRDLRVIEGKLEALLSLGKKDQNADDYLLVRLQDTDAILDAMGQLREVYPNILHLERPALMNQLKGASIDLDKIKHNELEMVEDFYTQTSGNTLSQAQKEILAKIITQQQDPQR